MRCMSEVADVVSMTDDLDDLISDFEMELLNLREKASKFKGVLSHIGDVIEYSNGVNHIVNSDSENDILERVRCLIEDGSLPLDGIEFDVIEIINSLIKRSVKDDLLDGIFVNGVKASKFSINKNESGGGFTIIANETEIRISHS